MFWVTDVGMEGIVSLPEATLSKEGTPKGAAKGMDTGIWFVFEVLGGGLATTLYFAKPRRRNELCGDGGKA